MPKKGRIETKGVRVTQSARFTKNIQSLKQGARFTKNIQSLKQGARLRQIVQD